MAAVPATLTRTVLHPTIQQKLFLEEIAAATYQTYCFVLDGLAAHRWQINEQNMLRVVDTVIRGDWIDNRPVLLCPMVMMKYLHREACHNWFDSGCDLNAIDRLKEEHANKFFMPASGHHILKDGSLYVAGAGYIGIDPVELPGRMYLIIGSRENNQWFADIKTAMS